MSSKIRVASLSQPSPTDSKGNIATTVDTHSARPISIPKALGVGPMEREQDNHETACAVEGGTTQATSAGLVVACVASGMAAPAPAAPPYIGELSQEAMTVPQDAVDIGEQARLGAPDGKTKKTVKNNGKAASFARPSGAAAKAGKKKLAEAMDAAAGEDNLAALIAHATELRIPRSAWPTRPSKGQKNYTIASACGATIEVQHGSGTFLLRKPEAIQSLVQGSAPVSIGPRMAE